MTACRIEMILQACRRAWRQSANERRPDLRRLLWRGSSAPRPAWLMH